MRVVLLLLMWVTESSVAHAQQQDLSSALWDRARAAQRRGGDSVATILYDSLLRRRPRDAAALNNRGNAQRRMGRAREAVADYTAAIQFSPAYSLAYANRAEAWLALGDSNAAVRDLDRAIALDSMFARAWHERGALKIARGMETAGLIDIRRAAALLHGPARRLLAIRGEAPPVLRKQAVSAVESIKARREESGVRFVGSLATPRALLLVVLALATLVFLMWLPLRFANVAEVVNVEAPDGERHLWAGVPRQGLVLRSGDAFGIVFSLLWLSFALGLTGWLILSLGPAAILITSPFLLFGLYFVIGRFFHDAWRRKRTLYSLTDRHAMIVRGGSIQTLAIDKLPPLTLEEWNDGSGTITFGETNLERSRRRGKRQLGWSVSPAFELIADAPQVFALIEQARATQADATRAGARREPLGERRPDRTT